MFSMSFPVELMEDGDGIQFTDDDLANSGEGPLQMEPITIEKKCIACGAKSL